MCVVKIVQSYKILKLEVRRYVEEPCHTVLQGFALS